MEEQQQNYINATMMELKDDLGALGAPNRTTYDELQQLVLRVVALNVEISQLPYELTLYPCALGLPFTKSFMTDTTAQEDESHLENSKEIVTLVFCRAIAKCWFNEAGMSEASCSAILMKAPVSCEDLSQA